VLYTAKTDTDRLEALQAFKDSFNGENVTDEDLNVLAKAIFDRVEYIRQGDNVQVKVKFQ
jgi:site-specific DNA recombinase